MSTEHILISILVVGVLVTLSRSIGWRKSYMDLLEGYHEERIARICLGEMWEKLNAESKKD